MTAPTKITITPDHLKLLSRMYVGWQDCETGAPEIDPKRPYGNSGVANDVYEILEWEPPVTYDRGEVELDEDVMYDRAMLVHRETEHALQILLRHPGEDILGDWSFGKLYEWERS